MFRFEADFAGDLRCLPLAVRRKLDLAGVKLKLVHWHGLSDDERQRLLAWPDDGTSLEDLRQWLLERSHTLPQGPAS
ncbi:MAG: nitrate reductase associated protein, partial [Cyanobacteriota bacterium]|nr:nitrate reductase associated protein [Cyanobacteriota bacterium]